MVVYDDSFNLNEIFVITLIVSSIIIVRLLPRRFSRKETILFILYGASISTFFDNLMGIQLINYYDINDTSFYGIYDALLYMGYGPIGYIFFYLYDKYFIHGGKAMLYIMIWSLLAILVEFIAERMGVFHYINGYKTFYSFPIYLLVQSIAVGFYYWVKYLSKNDDKIFT